MADLNSTIVRGNLRATEDTIINGSLTVGLAASNSNKSLIVNGKFVVNPSYNTAQNSYNEGFRVNAASNGWAEIAVGGSAGSTSGTSNGLWIIGKRGAAGSTSGAAGDFTIEHNGSNGTGLTLYANGNRPRWNNNEIAYAGDLSSYLPLSGGTLNGLLTTTSGANHSGVKIGSTYVNAINGELILQNNTSIRFGGDSWDYNVWAGLKYNHSTKTVYLGLADGTQFTANNAQSGGKLRLPGISEVHISGTTSNDMTYSTANPKLVFSENGGQSVGIVYTDYDSYRASKGLKVMDVDNSDGGHVWLEAPYFYGNGAGLTSLNGSNIASGTVPFARLPTGTGENQIAIGNHTHNYVSKSGDTMTGVLTMLGGQYTDSLSSGALNMNNSDIYGLNSIKFADLSDNAGEGIHFYRDATHADTLWDNGGVLYYAPNRAYGTGTTATNSEVLLHSGNYTSYALPKTGANYNTATKTNYFKISRNGGDKECLSIGVDDSEVLFDFLQDEVTANFKFVGRFDDSEDGGGASAGSHTFQFNSSSSGASITIDGTALLKSTDIKDWAKGATKPSYTHDEIGAGNLTVGDGSYYLNMRSGHSSYDGGIYYSTPGNEAMIFAAKSSVTSFIFKSGLSCTSGTSWQNLTPDLQIKNGKVTINKLIANDAQGAYNLDVNGTLNATTIYQNGTTLANTYAPIGHTHSYNFSDIGNRYESYLEWGGGQQRVGNFSPLDAALVPNLGANRVAGVSGAAVEIERSNDGGSTWTTVDRNTITNDQRQAFFTTSNGINLKYGATNNTTDRLRITLNATDYGIYTEIFKIMMLVSTSGSSGCKVLIETAYYESPTTWRTVGTYDIEGWSGWNVINLRLPGTSALGGSNYGQHNKFIRFTYSCTGTSSTYTNGLTVYNTYMFGGVGWATPSTLAEYGTPYKYDSAGSMIIPNANFYINGSNNYLSVNNGGIYVNGHIFSDIASNNTSQYSTTKEYGLSFHEAIITKGIMSSNGGTVLDFTLPTTAGRLIADSTLAAALSSTLNITKNDFASRYTGDGGVVNYNNQDHDVDTNPDTYTSTGVGLIRAAQKTVSIIRTPLVNIDGYDIGGGDSLYSSTTGTFSSGFDTFEYVGIKYNDSELITPTRARYYMWRMTGSTYLPTYGYNVPEYSYLIDSSSNFYKVQYQANVDTSGSVSKGYLRLFKLPTSASGGGNIRTIPNSIEIQSDSTNGNYSEGVRIHAASNGYADVVLCDSTNTSNTGTTTNTWTIHNNAGTFGFYKGDRTTSAAVYLRGSTATAGWVANTKFSATSFYATSDRRLKDNIKKSDLDFLDLINRLKIKEFNFKKESDKENKYLGLIAQELYKELPEKYRKHMISEMDDEKHTLSINEGKVPYITMGAVQQLTKIVEKQQKRIDELEQQIAEINKKLDALLK